MPTRAATRPFPLVAWLARRSRGQRLLLLGVVALYVLYRLARIGAAIQLDRWWFETVTEAPVWSTITWAKVQLLVGAGLVTALLLGSSVWLALRSGPPDGVVSSGLVRQYQARMGPAHRWALVAVAVVLTERIAVTAMDQWQPWLLFRHGPSLDVDVPELGGDLGYHLFELPFLAIVSSWLRQLVLFTLALSLLGHVASGAIRLPIKGRRSSTGAIGHLCLLGALFAGVSALHFVLVRRPSLGTSTAGAFDGPGYTEVRVLGPSLWVLAVIALVAGFALVVWAATGRWKPAVAAVSAWAVLAVALLFVVPGLVQRYVVGPAEGTRELPYIEHNLSATRTAYGLDRVELDARPVADGIDDTDPAALDTVDRLPLFTTEQLVDPLQVLQGTTATRISAVDLDRYELDGVRRPVMLAARDASRADLPERGWVQEHLVYTHGDGVVAVPADVPAPDGRPDVETLDDVITTQRPELYFGESVEDWYAIVGTKRQEYDGTSFEADTGIRIDSWYRRLTLAATEQEIEPLFSAELTSDSQLLYRRGVIERLGALAPFLRFDGNPYPVVTADRITWVVDGYTTSSRYPYSQRASTAGLPAGSELAGDAVNYLHASVKATVDAYDGTVHLYRTTQGEDDPILEAWEEIFPGLIEPGTALPPELTEHLHYPSDLMSIQTQVLGRYHVDDAEALFSGAQEWSVAGAPSDGVGSEGSGQAAPVWLFMPGSGELAGSWVAIQPYSPGDAGRASSVRNELAALAIADHDDPERLQLVAVEDAAGRQVATPLVAQSAIDADSELARAFESLNAVGSKVQFGPMTPLLIDDGLAWARTIIVTGTATTTAPRLYGVVVVSNGLVGVGDDVSEALADVGTGAD